MVRKGLLLVGLMLVLSLGFVASAAAAADEAAAVEGSGRLWARGIGYAEVHGNGAVDITVHGIGTILVLTGITRRQDVKRSATKPGFIADDLHQLRAAWDSALAGRR